VFLYYFVERKGPLDSHFEPERITNYGWRKHDSTDGGYGEMIEDYTSDCPLGALYVLMLPVEITNYGGG